MDIFLMCRKS